MAAAIVTKLSSSATTTGAAAQQIGNKHNMMRNGSSGYVIADGSYEHHHQQPQSQQQQQQNVRIVHKIGDLVWAKLGSNPWWPCCVVKDVTSERFYHVVEGDKLMFHVEFMGGTKERGWVHETNMFKYDGIDSFKTYAQDQVDRAVSKMEKEQLAERFQLKVSLNRKENWQRAVQCADDFVRSIKNLKRKRENTRERNIDETFEDMYHKKYMMNGVKNENIFKLNEMQNKPETIMINNTNNNSACLADARTLSERNHSYLPMRKMVPNMKNEDNTNNNINTSNNKINRKENYHSQREDDEMNENYFGHVNHPDSKTNDQEDTNQDEEQEEEDDNDDQDSDDNDDENDQTINEAPTEIYDYDHLNQMNSAAYGQKPPMLFNNNRHYLLSSEFSQEDSKQLTITSILNEKNNKKRGRKPKTTTQVDKNAQMPASSLSENQLKLKIKLNTRPESPTRSRSNISMGSSKRSTSSDTSTSNSLESDGRPKTIYPKNEFASLSSKKHDNKNTAKATSTPTKLTKEQLSRACSYDVQNYKKSKQTLDTNLAADKGKKRRHLKQQNDDDDDEDEEDDDDDDDDEEEIMMTNVATNVSSSTETYLIDRYKYAVRHIQQGLSVEEACNKYRISKGALLKCLSGGTAPRGKKTRLTESEEKEIVDWLINYKDLKYNDAIHLVFDQVVKIFEQTKRPNPFNNGKPSMDWWYDFLSRHPQIMASKPDWLKRGKVNDKYIQDVQSGQLKCTKFRRALLSAIQYINTLNEQDRPKCNFALNSTNCLSSSTASSASSSSATPKNPFKSKKIAQQKSTTPKPTSSVKNKKCPPVNQQPYQQLQIPTHTEPPVKNVKNPQINTWHKPAPAYSNFSTSSTVQTHFNSLIDSYPNMLDSISNPQQQQTDVDYVTNLKDEPYCNENMHNHDHDENEQHTNNDVDDDEGVEDDEDDDEEDDDDDENNLTFGNELFIHSPLNENEFENLIDSGQLMDKEDQSEAGSNHHHHHHHDINNNHYPVDDCLLNQKRPNLNGHLIYATQSDLKSCQHQMHPMHYNNNSNNSSEFQSNVISQQHLLVPDDDDDDHHLNNTNHHHHHHNHQSNNYNTVVKCQNEGTFSNMNVIKTNHNVSALNQMTNSNLINDDEDELMVNTIDPSTFLT